MLKAIFFDLDGTLLDTINDIKEALNDALKKAKIPLSYQKEEVKSFLGNGADALLHKALNSFDNEANFKALKEAYLPLYKEYQRRNTYPFDGVNEALKELSSKGIKLFICTNKPHQLALEVVAKALPEINFVSINGQEVGMPPKPDPIILNREMGIYSLKANECLFIGDSLPDVLTARNGKMKVGLCKWGYGDFNGDLLEKSDFSYDKPADWLKHLE